MYKKIASAKREKNESLTKILFEIILKCDAYTQTHTRYPNESAPIIVLVIVCIEKIYIKHKTKGIGNRRGAC